MSTLTELLNPLLEQEGDKPAAGIALVLWDGEGQISCQYTGVVLDVPDIARLLLSGAMELTHRMEGKPPERQPDAAPRPPKIEVVE